MPRRPMPRPLRLVLLLAPLLLSACATTRYSLDGDVVTIRDGTPSNTRDGKCNRPPYTAPSCVYLY